MMKNPILEPLETNLMNLKWIANRLDILGRELSKIKGNEKEWFGITIQEYMIIQLDCFIETRKNLLENLQNIGKHALDEALKPFWEYLIKFEKPIKELRDSYIAHVQNNDRPFSQHVFEIHDKYQFPYGFDDTIFLGGCVCLYKDYIFKNLPDHVSKTEQKYRSIRPTRLDYDLIPPSKALSFLEPLKVKVAENLKKLNLRY